MARPSSCIVVRKALVNDPFVGLPSPTSHVSEGVGNHPPFVGGWIGYISYDMGRVIEPRAGYRTDATAACTFPLMHWARCDDALVHDAESGEWYQVGTDVRLIELLDERRHAPPGANAGNDAPAPATSWKKQNLAAAPVEPTMKMVDQREYESHVQRAIEYIRAGDIYQANIAHRIEARPCIGAWSDDPRRLFQRILQVATPWYGAYLEVNRGEVDAAGSMRGAGGAVVSASPELFLKYHAASRRIETRPMKGTAAGESGRAALARSEKDRAELNMIVDLMRNDLGRVSDFGTVRVEDDRVIEQHGGGVLQGVATVTGRLRVGLGLRDLLRATFPPGSVTGAPKVRAMQVIDEIEPHARGPYCGAIGYISDNGDAQFSVAIRTALVEPADDGTGTGRITYSVGAGIVADSSPTAEWHETIIKAGTLMRSLEIEPTSVDPPHR